MVGTGHLNTLCDATCNTGHMAPFELFRLLLLCAVAVVFIAMGISHFLPGPARTMAAMIPPAMRRAGILRPMHLVWFTGLCEIAGGVGLLIPVTRVAAGVALVVFLVAVFPANAFAARHPDQFGRAAIPFWPRLIGQIALVALVLFVAL
jgi:uncharacterized membrane protein